MFASLPWSYWLGIALVVWLIYDLISGSSYLWRAYRRSEEPTKYWLTLLLWSLVAVSCFVFPYWTIT
ncbi:hypothetical protein EYS14_04895 [Alteromonadaceae bacterium M269]|nr:hypothetical protein EYS14_04895 [Alteromonadaceae bacterium M269]